MRRDVLANMLCRLFIAHAAFMAQRDIADIRVELMRVRVTIPVSFIGADRMFVPLAGEDALSADGFKSVSNAPDTGKQIDKAEGIVGMGGGRTRKQCLQITKLAVAQAMPCPLAGDKSLYDCRAPVALTVCHELAGEGFGIIDIQQLAQQRLHRCR